MSLLQNLTKMVHNNDNTCLMKETFKGYLLEVKMKETLKGYLFEVKHFHLK